MRPGRFILRRTVAFPRLSSRSCLRRSRLDARNRSLAQDYYQRLRESGIHYGPFFQSIAQLWRHDGEMLGEVQVPDGPDGKFNACQVHPAILDACLQTLGAGVAAEATENGKQGHLHAHPHR